MGSNFEENKNTS